MRKKNQADIRSRAVILLLHLASCISLPERPPSDREECVGRLFSVRREVAAVEEENRMFQTAMGFSVVFSLFIPVLIVVPIIGSPIAQLYNKSRADAIVRGWEQRYCQDSRQAE